jgi:hypothetical protein
MRRTKVESYRIQSHYQVFPALDALCATLVGSVTIQLSLTYRLVKVLIFFGALSHKSSTFLIGAYALATQVMLETDSDSPHLSNGAYWHFNPRDSFGFSENTILNKISSHTEEHSIAHLSWTIDKNVKTENLRGIKIGEKEMTYHIFNCPGNC